MPFQQHLIDSAVFIRQTDQDCLFAPGRVQEGHGPHMASDDVCLLAGQVIMPGGIFESCLGMADPVPVKIEFGILEGIEVIIMEHGAPRQGLLIYIDPQPLGQAEADVSHVFDMLQGIVSAVHSKGSHLPDLRVLLQEADLFLKPFSVIAVSALLIIFCPLFSVHGTPRSFGPLRGRSYFQQNYTV